MRTGPQSRARGPRGAACLLALAFAACQPFERPADVAAPAAALTPASLAAPQPAEGRYSATGEASWYGAAHHGRKTANGDRFDKNELTAAHRTLPFGARLAVTNLENDRCVEVVVTDRGPYLDGRLIDLSEAAARRLGMLKDGVATVRIEEAPGRVCG